MSTIPKQTLIIDNDTDIGLTSDLINGTYKSSSLTDLSNNLYTKITDLSSNVYSQLSNKQATLTSSTSLLGNGSNISSLNYNNLINKPTNFQSDWATTIINKPDLTGYLLSSTANSTYATISNLNTKQNTLTFTTPLIKDVSNNVSINLSGYLLSSTASSTYATISTLNTKQNTISVSTPLIKDVSNNITIDLSAYDTIALRNTALGSYLLSSTASSTYATISSLNTKENALTFSSPLTRTTNTIGINLSTYSTTGTDPNFLKLIGGTLTGTLTLPTNSWSIKTADNIDRIYFNNGGTTYFHSGNTNGDGFKFRSTAQLDIMTLTDAGALTATSFSGNGAALTNLAYANINGKPTNFQADWNSTIINKPSTFPADMTTIYSKTETDTLLNAKQATLTAATNLLGIGSSISALDYTKITIGKPTNFQADWNSTIINKPSTFPADMTTIYTKTETNTLLNAKEAILTFSSPLTRTTNTIGINLANYSTTGNDSSYLLKTGGTLTGNFNIEKSNPIVSIKSALESETSILYLSTPLNTTSGLKTAIIAQGLSAWGRSKLHFCLNDNQTDNSTAQNASVSHSRLTIQPNGYVGINTTTPPCRFTIKMSYNDGNTGGLSINSDDGTTYNLKLYSYVQNSGQVGYKFEVNNVASSVNAIILNYNGVVTIPSLNTTNFLLGGYDLYYYLFNNTGQNHGDITDFNNIANFGFKFVMGGTNGPGTPSTNNQWYTWSMGLGANYPYSQYVCQCAIPRNTSFPTLSVRYKEGTTWGGWTGITSSFADGLTSGNKSISGNLNVYGQIYCSSILKCAMLSVPNSGSDYVGVQLNTSQGTYYNTTLCIMYGTFTGFHRCFTKDALYDNDDPQKFKDDYMGRIVISTGKIATDMKTNDEWEIKYDKAGITIEDALPEIELSRTKKDKRVFGVLGMASRNNSRPERMIINSVGEGGIWICNSNGNIENGDYITSSDYLGYGEKQDDDLLHNYTVAKATIDCNFELDSSLYNCLELENGVKIAFIACTYHCG